MNNNDINCQLSIGAAGVSHQGGGLGVLHAFPFGGPPCAYIFIEIRHIAINFFIFFLFLVDIVI